MEQQLYQTALLVSGILCLGMGLALLKYFTYYGIYPHYRRLRLLVALALGLTGTGCLLHWHFGFLPPWIFTLLLLVGLVVLIAIFYNIYELGTRLSKYDGTPRTEL
jgi:hypothetical protein